MNIALLDHLTAAIDGEFNGLPTPPVVKRTLSVVRESENISATAVEVHVTPGRWRRTRVIRRKWAKRQEVVVYVARRMVLVDADAADEEKRDAIAVEVADFAELVEDFILGQYVPLSPWIQEQEPIERDPFMEADYVENHLLAVPLISAFNHFG